MSGPFDYIPSDADWQRYTGLSTANAEILPWTLYDFQLYPTAGQTAIDFFQQIPGQGKTSTPGVAAGSGKTLADTNMTLPGQLPQGQAFWLNWIEGIFYPGSVSTTDTFTPAVPGMFATDDSVALVAQANDVELIRQTGVTQLYLNNNKLFLQETPFGVFPPQTGLAIDAAIGDVSATTPGALTVTSAKMVGEKYYVNVPLAIQSGVSFKISQTYPAAVATPSGFNGRIGFKLHGYLLRAS